MVNFSIGKIPMETPHSLLYIHLKKDNAYPISKHAFDGWGGEAAGNLLAMVHLSLPHDLVEKKPTIPSKRNDNLYHPLNGQLKIAELAPNSPDKLNIRLTYACDCIERASRFQNLLQFFETSRATNIAEIASSPIS